MKNTNIKFISLLCAILITGCQSHQVIKMEKVNYRLTPEQLNYKYSQIHHKKANEMGIPFVDYLHMINSEKTKVKKSYIKYTHINQ